MTEETPINSNPTEGGEEEAEAMGKKESSSSPSHVEKTRKNDSSDSNNATAAMDFMSPYDVPQTVYVTQPHGGSKKKKKRGGKKKKKGKKSLASSSLLDSLAEF